MTLDQLIDEAELRVRMQHDETGQVHPFCLAETDDGGLAVLPFAIDADGRRDGIVESMRAEFNRLGVVRYAVAYEGWLSARRDVRPIDAPDRRLMLVVIASDSEGASKTAVWTVRTPESGRHELETRLPGGFGSMDPLAGMFECSGPPAGVSLN